MSEAVSSPIPFLRWAGSKRVHVPFLKTYWSSEFLRYVEPFAGSAALYFAIQPKRALLGDLNGELIQSLRAVRADPETVSRRLQRLPKGRDEYYSVRSQETKRLGASGRAARFIYLNRFCFNGLYRTNLEGRFNVPFGRPKSGNIPTLRQLRACSDLLRTASIIRADFRRTLARVKAGDFVYIDPPYAVSNRRIFVEYGRNPFTVEDLEDLGIILRMIAGRGAKFVVSYADCRESRTLLSEWQTKRVPIRRNVAGFSGARRIQYELYATNISTA